jgi:hypothetical protein
MSRIGAHTRLLRRAALAALLLAAGASEARTDHGKYKDSAPAECRACHRTSGVTDNHGATFLREHRLPAQKATKNCFQCHAENYCADCHDGGNLEATQKQISRRGEPLPRTHAANYVATHGVFARDDGRSCARCHQSQSFCSDCHATAISRAKKGQLPLNIRPHSPTYVAPNVPDPAWVNFHKAEARRNLQNCQGCHPDKSSCSNFACHPGLQGR